MAPTADERAYLLLSQQMEPNNSAFPTVINAHNFFASQLPWMRVSENFRAQLSVLSENELAIQEMLEHWRLTYEAHPHA